MFHFSIRTLFALVFSITVFTSGTVFANIDKASCHRLWTNFLEYNDLESEYKPLIGTCNKEFKSKLQKIISTNIDLGYWQARNLMFSFLDNKNGVVCGVYVDKCVETQGIPNSSEMNCEHSWPQSRGATGIAKSDLHHLYPVSSRVNSRRSNHPFCNVDVVKTEENGSYLGDSFSGTRCFEPRPEHKGDVARSMIYFAVRYGHKIDQEQEDFFREWMREDVVSAKEKLRNDRIESVQMNRNPFVDYPEFSNFMSDI